MAESAREAVLARIRAALGGRAGVRDTLDGLLEAPLGHARPAGGAFLRRLEETGATWERVADRAAVGAALGRYCADHAIRELWPAPALAGWDWPMAPATAGPVAPDASLAVCRAALGVAETGSLVLEAQHRDRAAHPVLAEHLVVLLNGPTVVDHLEDVWAHLRAGAPMPWTVSLVSGPSRTADIEQTLEIGAHGPRRVHVLLCEEGGL